MHSSNMISNYQTPQRNRVQNVSVSKPRKLPSLQLVRTSPHAAFPLQRKLYFSQTQTLHIDTNTTHRHKHYTFTTTTVQQSTPRREYTPPKGSRRRGRDHAVAASAPAHDKSDHKQNLSKTHKLPSMATVRTNPHATFRCRIFIHVCVCMCVSLDTKYSLHHSAVSTLLPRGLGAVSAWARPHSPGVDSAKRKSVFFFLPLFGYNLA